jgi:RHS repeat-associated protein
VSEVDGWAGQTEVVYPTNYLYDGKNLLEEFDSNGYVLARYTTGRKMDDSFAELRSGGTSYYEADGLGSITSLSNSAGALVNTYSYDSFGNPTATTGTIVNPFRFTAREFDSETGIYQYRARYYDQNVGRFLSEDPLKGISDGVNFYAYVHNSSINLIDPTGLSPECSCSTPSRYRLVPISDCHHGISRRIVGYRTPEPNVVGTRDS